jgi:LacI family transcriptional regulator
LDNVRGARECVRHLIQSGHRRIAIITGELKVQNARERLQGYEEALREADITIDPALILEGDYRYEAGNRLAKHLIQSGVKATAIFVCNGVMTLGVLNAFEELGIRCPENMALATFDDLTLDHSFPFHSHLTAVVQPGYEMGARAATILMNRIEGKLTGDPVVVRIVPTLIIRESTRSPRYAPNDRTLGRKTKNLF